MSKDETIELKKLDPNGSDDDDESEVENGGLLVNENLELRDRSSDSIRREARSETDNDVQQPLLDTTTPDPTKRRSVKRVRYSDLETSPVEQENLLPNTSDNNNNLDETTTNLGGGLESSQDQDDGDHVNRIRFPTSLPKTAKIILLASLAIACCLFLFSFIPSFIFRLEYYEMALVRNTVTGRVYFDYTYEPGLHVVLPWYEPLKFDKSVQTFELNELNIFTTDKLSVKTSFTICYFLDKNQLGKLYQKFELGYEPVIESVFKTVLLNHGLEFSVEDYRTKRHEIRMYLKNRLKDKLESEYAIKIFEVYLARITFIKEINNLNLLRMLNGIYNEKAGYDKQTNVTRAETEYQINKFKNEALLVIESAQAKAINEVKKIEETNRNVQVEMAHLNGLNMSVSQLKLFDRSNKLDQQKTISFCYLSSLINNENVRFINKDNQTKIGHFVIPGLNLDIKPGISVEL